MITLSTARQLFELLNQEEERLSTYEAITPLHQLEMRYSFFILNKIFRHTPYETIHIPLEKMLYNRWCRIMNTDINYCQDFENPANVVCVAISKALSSEFSPSLIFLMPSLTEHDPATYLTSSYEDEIDLHECILNDDGTRLINIRDVLSFAKVDGLLKCNYLSDDGKMEQLTPAERDRLHIRHPSISLCLDAIHKRLTFTHYGNTTGLRLIV